MSSARRSHQYHAQVYAFAKGVSEHLLPRTTAYHEIWLDKKLVAGEALKEFEPLYGVFYLPRKVIPFHFFFVFFSFGYLITIPLTPGRVAYSAS